MSRGPHVGGGLQGARRVQQGALSRICTPCVPQVVLQVFVRPRGSDGFSPCVLSEGMCYIKALQLYRLSVVRAGGKEKVTEE